MRRYLLISAAILVVAFGVGAGIALLENPRVFRSADDNGTLLEPASELPDFVFEDLDGRPRSSDEWPEHVLIINFWATWCPPCRAETPTFVQLQDEFSSRNVQFVGIAIDDREPVAEFADTYGVNYPILLGGLEAVELSRKLGNRLGGLPYTVVVDRRGDVRHRHPGEMTKDRLEQILQSLL